MDLNAQMVQGYLSPKPLQQKPQQQPNAIFTVSSCKWLRVSVSALQWIVTLPLAPKSAEVGNSMVYTVYKMGGWIDFAIIK